MPAKQAGFPVTVAGVANSIAALAATVNAGTNRIMFVALHFEVLTEFATTVTYGGVDLKRYGRAVGTSFAGCELWYLIGPAVGTANVVVTTAGVNQLVMSAQVYDDVDQYAPFRDATLVEQAAATSISITLDDVQTGDLLIDFLTVDGTGHSTAPGANETEQYDVEGIANSTTGVSDLQAGVDGGVLSHTWTGSNPSCGFAIALRSPRAAQPDLVRAAPSAKAGGSPPPTRTAAHDGPDDGATPASAASAWGFGSWAEVLPNGWPYDIAIYGLTFEVTNVPALDTTIEELFEIGTGAPGAEVTKVQVPYTLRADTGPIGYYLERMLYPAFGEPMLVPAGTRVAVRAADSLASVVTYEGVKVYFREVAAAVVALPPGHGQLRLARQAVARAAFR